MEVKKTIPVKLDVPEERKEDLHQTIKQFNQAANHTIENARNDEDNLILSKTNLHDKVYHNLRDKTNLPSNLCIRAYTKALEALKSTVADWKEGNSRPLPEFDSIGVEYDKRTLTIKDRHCTLSTVNGRVKADYILGDYQKQFLDNQEYERRMGSLRYEEEKDEFYLHIVVESEVEKRDGDKVLGVDLNLKNVAVTSTGEFFDSGELLWG